MSALVSTDWLAAHLNAPDIAIVDASWHMPATGRKGAEEYRQQRIPGAVFFDIDAIADTASPYPHMLPSPEKFASRVRKLGIGDGKRVIVYDASGIFSAPRVWWMFRIFGHEDVAVLDGGLPKWIAEGRPLEDGPPRPVQERHFTARMNTLLLRDRSDVQSAITSKTAQIADARSPGRFAGTEPEPRAGLRGGHMPGARNLPFGKLLTANGTMKPPAEIAAAFADAGVDTTKPIITSCGSGVSAAVLALGLAEIGAAQVALYDGSWSEWGADPSLPVEC